MNKPASPTGWNFIWDSEEDEGKRGNKPNREPLKIIFTSRLGFYVNSALRKINFKENI